MGYLLGIDVGTSGARALLCDEGGRVVATATTEYPAHSPRPLWSEQDPEDWWRGTCESVRMVLARAGIDGKEVRGIGLSGQMHGLVMLDAAHRVIRPAILWNDQRTAAECRQMTDAVGAERLLELACNPALTGFTAPKILWVRNNEPQNYERCRKVLLPKDYVRFRLSGAFATEVSDASGMLLLDIRRRDWSDEILGALRDRPRPAGRVPRVPGGQRDRQRRRGAGDRHPGRHAHRGRRGRPGGGRRRQRHRPQRRHQRHHRHQRRRLRLQRPRGDGPQGRLHTFCHAVPGKWHVMGVVLSAGGSLQWFRNHLAEPERALAEEEGVDPYEVLCAEAARADAGCEGLLFLPYLTGERTPHADPNARGALVGLTPRHGRNEVVRSIMEGITYAMKDSLEIIRSMGIAVDEVRLSGGGARSEFWRQMQADVYENAVCTINADEGPAYGVALLAGVGTGVWSSVEEACEQSISVVRRHEVQPENVRVYREYYPVFQSLYRSLKGDFATITGKVAALGR